jgi:hypothetical protein
MDDAELAERLRERGYTLGDAAVREDCVFLWQINNVFMFRRDVVDLANGSATIGEVIQTKRRQGVSGRAPASDRVPEIRGEDVPGDQGQGGRPQAQNR